MKVDLSFEIDAEAVIAIAEAAGDVILEVYNSPTEDWAKQTKGDGSPLTIADQRANELICERLAQLAPHVPIVSEENKAVAYETRKGYQYSWCVDPLDGTKEFIKRNGQFTVNIALLRGERPVLGVVHTPCQENTHWAEKGRGAFKRASKGGEDTKLECATFSEADEGLAVVASASHSNEATESFIAAFKSPTLTSMGSSLKLMLVAEGKAHVYPRLAPTCEWDTCASQIVVEEAGGCVLQAVEGRPPVVYNKENPLNPYFLVYGKCTEYLKR